MNEMLDAQNSLYDAAFVSAEEFYSQESFYVVGDSSSDSVAG